MFRVDADHPHHTLAVDDLALVTDFLYRCSYFHISSQFLVLTAQFDLNRVENTILTISFITIHNSAAIQVVGGKLHRYLVTGQDANKILAHLSRNMRQHLVLVLQFHLEHGVGQRLKNHCHHFNRVFFAHRLLKKSVLNCQFPVSQSKPSALYREPRTELPSHFVKITGPSFVTATQCSKCALKLPSTVTAVHLSSSTLAPGLP